MTSKFRARLFIAAFCLLILGMAVGAGFRIHETTGRAERTLADHFRVERLPASARDIECQDVPDPCDPGNFSTMCFVRIEPGDFDVFVRQAHLRKNLDTCPEDFSHTHQMGLTIGPSFKINEEHRGGTAEARADLYPDAAHAQFVAVLSRPSRSPLHCN